MSDAGSSSAQIVEASIDADDEEVSARGSGTQRKQWTQLEDDTVRALVHQHGTRAWTTVALSLPGRTGKQCRERWLYQLDLNINKSAWSLDEDRKLMQLHDEFGNKWTDIAKYLPGRSGNGAVRNHWNVTLRRGENIAHMLVDGQLPMGFPEGLPSLPGSEPSRNPPQPPPPLATLMQLPPPGLPQSATAAPPVPEAPRMLSAKALGKRKVGSQ